MLEGLLTRALNDALGWLVEDVGKDKVRLAVTAGDVQLEDVALRKSAFRDLGLPLEVHGGRIRKLHVKIPWTRPFSEAVSVEIEDVWIQARVSEDEFSSSGQESPPNETGRENKMLKGLEQQRRERLGQFFAEKEETASWTWTEMLFGGAVSRSLDLGLSAAIAQNLRVRISNVVLMIENEDGTFQIGMRMPEFLVVPNDIFASSRSAVTRAVGKKARVSGLEIFTKNSNDDFDGETFFMDEDSKLIMGSTDVFADFPEIFVSGHPPSADTPRARGTVLLDGLDFKVDSFQFREISRLLQRADAEKQYLATCGLRPRKSIRKDPAAWWRYAFRKTLDERNARHQRTSWMRLGRLLKQSKEYHNLYSKQFQGPASYLDDLKPVLQLSLKDKEALEALEFQLSNEEILCFRNLSEATLLNVCKLEAGEPFSYRWMGIGGNSTSTILKNAWRMAQQDCDDFQSFSPVPDTGTKLFSITLSCNSASLAFTDLLQISFDDISLQVDPSEFELRILQGRLTGDLSESQEEMLRMMTSDPDIPCVTVRGKPGQEIDVEISSPISLFFDLRYAIEFFGVWRPQTRGRVHFKSWEDVFVEEIESARKFNAGVSRDACKRASNGKELHFRAKDLCVILPEYHEDSKSELGIIDGVRLRCAELCFSQMSSSIKGTAVLDLSAIDFKADVVRLSVASATVLFQEERHAFGVGFSGATLKLETALLLEDNSTPQLALKLSQSSDTEWTCAVSSEGIQKLSQIIDANRKAFGGQGGSKMGQDRLKEVSTGYFNESGALRDVFCNRLLTIVEVEIQNALLELFSSSMKDNCTFILKAECLVFVREQFPMTTRQNLSSSRLEFLEEKKILAMLEVEQFGLNIIHWSAHRSNWMLAPSVHVTAVDDVEAAYELEEGDSLFFDSAYGIQIEKVNASIDDRFWPSAVELAQTFSTKDQHSSVEEGTSKASSSLSRLKLDFARVCLLKELEDSEFVVASVRDLDFCNHVHEDYRNRLRLGSLHVIESGKTVPDALFWSVSIWPNSFQDLEQRIPTGEEEEEEDEFMLLFIDAHRKKREETMEVLIMLKQPRFCFSLPIVQKVLSFSETFVSGNDSRESTSTGKAKPGTTETLKLTFLMEDFVVHLPRQPGKNFHAWDKRDQFVLCCDQAEIYLGTTRRKARGLSSARSASASLSFEGDDEIFFDARSDSALSIDSETEVIQQQGISMKVALTNIAAESWLFESSGVLQTLCRFSGLMSLQKSEDMNVVNVQSTPVVIACSQTQYAAILDVIKLNNPASLQQQRHDQQHSQHHGIPASDGIPGIQFSLSLESILLTLFENDGGDRLPDPSRRRSSSISEASDNMVKRAMETSVNRLLEIFIDGIDGKLQRGEDQVGSGEASIKSMHLSTFSSNDDEIHDALRTDRTPIFRVTASISEESVHSVRANLANLELDSFELLLALSQFSRVRHYMQSSWNSVQQAEKATLSVKALQMEAQGPPTKSLQIPLSFDILFRCEGISIALSPRKNTEGLVLQLDLTLEGVGKSEESALMKIEVSSIEIFRKEKNELRLEILHPVSLEGRLSLKTQKSTGSEDVAEGELKVSKIEIVIGKRDLLLLSQAFGALSTGKAEKASASPSNQANARFAQPPQGLQVYFVVNVEATSSLTLYQDWVRWQPNIARMELDHVSLIARQFDLNGLYAQQHFNTVLSVRAKFWNVRSGAFEPLVEPWFCNVEVQMPEIDRLSPKQRLVRKLAHAKGDRVVSHRLASVFVRLQSRELFNINLTSASTELPFLLGQLFDESIPAAHRADLHASSSSRCFLLRNPAGIPLQISLEAFQKTEFVTESSPSEGDPNLSLVEGAVQVYLLERHLRIPKWFSRLICVKGRNLNVFRDKIQLQHGRPIASIPLSRGIFIRVTVPRNSLHEKHRPECAFQVVSQCRIFPFVCESIEDKHKILEALSAALQKSEASSDVEEIVLLGHGRIGGQAVRMELFDSNLSFLRERLLRSKPLMTIDLRSFATHFLRQGALKFGCVTSATAFEVELNDNDETFVDEVECRHNSAKVMEESSTVDLLRIEILKKPHRDLLQTCAEVEFRFLPGGQKATISTDVIASDESVVVTLASSLETCMQKQVIRVDLYDASGKLQCSGYEVFPPLLDREQLQQIFDLKLYRVGGSFQETSANQVGQVCFKVVAGADLCAMKEAPESLPDQVRIATAYQVISHEAKMLRVADEESKLPNSLRIAMRGARHLGTVAMNNSGRYALHLRGLHHGMEQDMLSNTLLCNLHFERGAKCVEFESCASLRNRLSQPVFVEFASVTRIEVDHDTFPLLRSQQDAFSLDRARTWSCDVEKGQKVAEIVLKKAATLFMYSVASAGDESDPPGSWTLLGKGPNEEEAWQKLDQRNNIIYSEPFQVRFFSVANRKQEFSKLRFVFMSCTPLVSQEEFATGSMFDVKRKSGRRFATVGNISLYKAIPELIHGMTLAPGESSCVPVGNLTEMGIMRFGEEDSEFQFFSDLVGSLSKATRRPSYRPVCLGAGMFGVLHSSVHRLGHVAKTGRTKDVDALYWILTLDPPMKVENALPFPVRFRLEKSWASELSSSPWEPFDNEEEVDLDTGSSLEGFAINPEKPVGATWRMLDGDEPLKGIRMRIAILSNVGEIVAQGNDAPVIFGDNHKEEYRLILHSASLNVIVLPASKMNEEDPDHFHFRDAAAQKDDVEASEESENLKVRLEKDGWKQWSWDAVPPLQVIVFSPIVIRNWTGLPLTYLAGEQVRKTGLSRRRSRSRSASHPTDEADEDVALLGLKSPLTFSETKMSPERLVETELFSLPTSNSRIALSLEGKSSSWSKEFALPVGMSGEATIPPAHGSKTVYQVGVVVAPGPGVFVRSKIVNITPRFLLVNKTEREIQLHQFGAPRTQLCLRSRTLAPFHPVDVNGDGRLDDKDFNCRLSFASSHDENEALGTRFFRLDVVQSRILPVAKLDAEIPSTAPCTAEDTLWPLQRHQSSTWDLLKVNIELVENVVRVIVDEPPKDRAFEYRVDNCAREVRVGIIQHSAKHRSMQVIGPGQTNKEWIWPDHSGRHEVIVFVSNIGLQLLHESRPQYAVAHVDFDAIGDPQVIRLVSLRIELRVRMDGLCKVLRIDDTAVARHQNSLSSHLQKSFRDAEQRISAMQEVILQEGLIPLDIAVNSSGNSQGASEILSGEASEPWESANNTTLTTTLTCEFETGAVPFAAYSFTVKNLDAHPRSWKVYAKRNADDEKWILLDNRSKLGIKDRIQFHVVSRNPCRTLFHLQKFFSKCALLKFEVHGPFVVNEVQLLYEPRMQPRQRSVNTKSKLVVAIVEARDLLVKDLYSSDPYVVLQVGDVQRKTSVVKSNLHPVFNEEFDFEVDFSEAAELKLRVFDKDLFKKDDFMGSASIALDSLQDANQSGAFDLWLTLREGNQECGQIRVVLQLLQPSKRNWKNLLQRAYGLDLFEEELELLQRLQEGRNPPKKLSSEESVSRDAMDENMMLDSRVERKLALSIRGARTSFKASESHLAYCVVKLGDRVLRTEPSPLTLRPHSTPTPTERSNASSYFGASEPSTPLEYEFEEVFEFSGPLGLQLHHLDTGYFEVLSIAAGSQAADRQRLHPGVRIIGVQNSSSRDLNLEILRDILSTAPRPLRIRFSDSFVEMQAEGTCTQATVAEVSWMQQLVFDGEDVLRAEAIEASDALGCELEGRTTRISVFILDENAIPGLDLNSARDTEKSLFVPLLHMLGGEDIESESQLRETEAQIGDNDFFLGDAVILLPDLKSFEREHEHDMEVMLRSSFEAQSDTAVHVGVRWLIDKAPGEHLIDFAVDASFRGISVSIVDTGIRRCELAFASVNDIGMYFGMHGDGREVYDLNVGRIQIDNQLPRAVHPIIVGASPAPFDWLKRSDELKHGKNLKRDTIARAKSAVRREPAFLVTLVKRNAPGMSELMYIEFFEVFLQELTVKFEERWLTAVQEFRKAISDKATHEQSRKRRGSILVKDESKSGQNRGLLVDVSPFSWIEGDLDMLGGGEARLLIERADIKPVKLNISFTMTSDSELRSENRLKILHLMQDVPILAAFASALVNTVVNISDAPFRFNSLQIFNEGMSKSMMQTTLVQHVMGQLLGNLSQMGNLIASADLLGSPVKLIGSFGKGAYSFFYEPALALSAGQNVGYGLQKGTVDLVRSTTNSAAASLERFIESMCRVVALASLDASFVQLESDRRNDVVNEPINLAEGTFSAVRALLRGFREGFGGVIETPVRDLQMYGAFGIITGVARGSWGLAIKPACGVLDSMSLMLKSIKNTTETSHGQDIPQRLPRNLRTGDIIRVYSARAAIGEYLMRFNCLPEHEEYLYHEYVQTVPSMSDGILISGGDEDEELYEEGELKIVLITSSLVNCVSFELATLEWALPLALCRVETEEVFVHITFGEGLREEALVVGDEGIARSETSARVSPTMGGSSEFNDVSVAQGYKFRCHSPGEAEGLREVLELGKRDPEICRDRSLSLERNYLLRTAELAILDPVGAKRTLEIAQQHLELMIEHRHKDGWGNFERSQEDDGTVPLLSGRRAFRALITGRSKVKGTVVFRIIVAAADEDCCWEVHRRYSEFRALRDAVTRQLQKSRTALPIPARHPWSLSEGALNLRQYGLNLMLEEIMRNEAIRESPPVLAFLTRDAMILRPKWEEAIRLY